MKTRTILHVDMDMFYVAVELRRHPELLGKPVVVGGDGARGVVAAASYEARRFGVFSAMSSAQARRLCPQAIFLPGDQKLYGEVSTQVFDIFFEFTPLVEGLSLDEAFMDVTGSLRLFGGGVEIAHDIRRRVQQETELVCSVGVAPSKFLAKLASKAAKPRATVDSVEFGAGVVEVRPGDELAFLRPLAVSALWGVGPATLAKLQRLGIATVADLAAFDLRTLQTIIGQAHGEHLHELANGRDDRTVVPSSEAKSIGHEETFTDDIYTRDDIHTHLVRLTDAVARRCRTEGLSPRTCTLKVKFADFRMVTRSRTSPVPLSSAPAMLRLIESALDEIDLQSGVRLVGISARNFSEPADQPSLFDDGAHTEEAADLDAVWRDATSAIDQIRDRFGSAAIRPASTLHTDREPGASPWGPSRHPSGGVTDTN
ncbi:MAG: DNA polymerase IV [Ilumatobacteraceae bacterium]